MVAMGVMFCLVRWETLALLGLLLGWAAVRSRMPVGFLLRGLRLIVLVAVLTFVFQAFFIPGEVLARVGPLSVSREGLEYGGRVAVRLVYLVLLSSLVTLTTSPIAIADSLEGFLKPLGRWAHDVAMVSTVALRFLPILALEAERIAKAQMARGARLDSGWPWTRVKAALPVIVPLLVRAFQHADDLALSMEARCYQGGVGRTRLHQPTTSARDVAFVLASWAALGGLVWLDWSLR